MPRELFADEEMSDGHERRRHAPVQEEDQRKRLELASLARLQEAGETAVAVGNAVAQLVVEGGKHKGDKVSFGSEGASMGRSSRSTLTLRMGAGVSRHHSKIVFDESLVAFLVEDLGSRNGTSVNGALIQGPTLLRDRDLIEISAERIRFFGPSPQGDDEEDSRPTSVAPDLGAPMPPPRRTARGGGPPPGPPGIVPLDEPPPSSLAEVTAPRFTAVDEVELAPPPLPAESLVDAEALIEEVAEWPLPEVDLPLELSVPAPPAPGRPSTSPSIPPLQEPEVGPLGAAPPAAAAPVPRANKGSSSAILFALGIFLGVFLIGAAFAVDFFVLDSRIATTVLSVLGLAGGDDDANAKPVIPDGPTVPITARGGGELKSIRVKVGAVVKSGDVVATVARGGPKDPKAHAKLLTREASLKRQLKSKRKKTRVKAGAALAKLRKKIEASNAGPVRVYNLRTQQDGTVASVLGTVGATLVPGDAILLLVPAGNSSTPPLDATSIETPPSDPPATE